VRPNALLELALQQRDPHTKRARMARAAVRAQVELKIEQVSVEAALACELGQRAGVVRRNWHAVRVGARRSGAR
jgi:hypothetical protein